MTMNLEDMGKTVNDARGITAIVLKQYRKILAARQMLWDWESIAVAMEMPGKPAQIRRAFGRITVQLKNHEVALPADGVIATGGKGTQRQPIIRPAVKQATGSSDGDPVASGKPRGNVDWTALHESNKEEMSGVVWKG